MPAEPDLDGSALSLAIVAARFNEGITSRLLEGAFGAVKRHSVRSHEVFWVPGSFELPVVAKHVAERGGYDAIVCLGAVIRHETDHYLHIATQAAAGHSARGSRHRRPLRSSASSRATPRQQALARSGDARNVGAEAVESVIETANYCGSFGQA